MVNTAKATFAVSIYNLYDITNKFNYENQAIKRLSTLQIRLELCGYVHPTCFGRIYKVEKNGTEKTVQDTKRNP